MVKKLAKVCKETVVLRRQGSETLKFGMKQVDKRLQRIRFDQGLTLKT